MGATTSRRPGPGTTGPGIEPGCAGRVRAGGGDRLGKALALIVGPEAMVVFKDVLQIDEREARKVRRWMIRALVEAARKPGPRA